VAVERVNTLLRVPSISTIFKKEEEKHGRNVSIPYFGFLPFLQKERRQKYDSSRVSIPYFGFLPFLQCVPRPRLTQRGCVNTLLRVPSISTMQTRYCSIYSRIVSIPYFGFLPFLRKQYEEKRKHQSQVSIPYFGFLPFLPLNSELLSSGQ